MGWGEGGDQPEEQRDHATGGAAGPTPPGEHRRIRTNHTRITPGCTRDASGRTRTHQDTSSITTDNTRTHRTTQDLKRQTEGEPGPGGLCAVGNPSDRKSIASRAHTASHRTHERNETISRLVSHPQAPICTYRFFNLKSKISVYDHIFVIR